MSQKNSGSKFTVVRICPLKSLQLYTIYINCQSINMYNMPMARCRLLFERLKIPIVLVFGNNVGDVIR